MTARRELRLAVLLCLVGAALTLWAVRQPWVSYPASEDITIKALRTSVRGTAVASVAQALALVGVTGVVAIAATKRVGRVLVGLLVGVAGVLVVVDVGHLLTTGLGHRLATSGCRGLCVVPQERYDRSPTWTWPVLTLAGSALMAAGGLLVALRGRQWAALSSAYEVPAARHVSAEPTDKAAWDLLDSGDDPTT
jgi:uncharacterized membrane protein (TIGR02234 family)